MIAILDQAQFIYNQKCHEGSVMNPNEEAYKKVKELLGFTMVETV